MAVALILCGGRATRLCGVDKAFIELGGRPLIAHLIERLNAQVSAIAISANGDPARFAAFGLPVIADELEDRGPLAGVAAGLTWASASGETMLLTVPVDTPFIPLDLGARLAPGPSVACHGGRQHHLAALWETSFSAALNALLSKGSTGKAAEALRLAGARAVTFGGTFDPFKNINTPEDLAAARGIYEALHPRA